MALSLTHSRVNFDPWMISVEIDRLIDALSARLGSERERERENAMIDTQRHNRFPFCFLNVARSFFPVSRCAFAGGLSCARIQVNSTHSKISLQVHYEEGMGRISRLGARGAPTVWRARH